MGMKMPVLLIQPKDFLKNDVIIFFSGFVVKLDSIEKRIGAPIYAPYAITGTEYNDKGRIRDIDYDIGNSYHLVVRS